MNQETPFKLVANCLPVKGFKRSVVCDLQRSDMKLIPNDLFDIILNHQGLSIKSIKKIYKNEYDEVLDDYFRFLDDNEFILFTEDIELFPDLNLQWKEKFVITNAIFDVDKNSSYDIFEALKKLNEIDCKHLEIRFFRTIELKEINNVLSFLDSNESNIISVDFNFPYIDDIKDNVIIELIENEPRLSSTKIYNSNKNNFVNLPNNKGYIVFSDTILKNEFSCGNIYPSLFSINIKTYTESLKHNSCLNRKISIDVNGNIKNCPSMSQSFGNIKDITLQEALSHKDLKKYWNISKDQIDVCKDCEFRYVCTDCRAYKENPENDYSKPLKCGYSPYTNKWEEWSVNPLKQKAITYYGMQDLVKTDA